MSQKSCYYVLYSSYFYATVFLMKKAFLLIMWNNKTYRMKLRMIWRIMQVKEGIIIQREKNLQDLHLNSL